MISHSQKSSAKNLTLPFFCKKSWHRFLPVSLVLAQRVVNRIKPFAGISPITTAESSHLAEPWLSHAKYLLLPLPITGFFFEIQEKGAAQNSSSKATNWPAPENPGTLDQSLGKSTTSSWRSQHRKHGRAILVMGLCCFLPTPHTEQHQCSQPPHNTRREPPNPPRNASPWRADTAQVTKSPNLLTGNHWDKQLKVKKDNCSSALRTAIKQCFNSFLNL